MTRLSRETEELLELGRGGTPLTPGHRARLRGAILAKATGFAVVATAGSAAAWTSLGVKIVGAVALVAAVGGAGAAVGARMSNRTPTALATLAVTAVAMDRATTPSWGSSAQTPTAMGPRTAASIATPAPVAALIATPPSIATPALIAASARRATLTPVTAAVPSIAVPTPSAVPASEPTSTLARDVRLLRDADLAVKGGDPERALALLDEHAATFPRSDLEPERSAERIFALCHAGRIDEARSATSAFLGAHPSGPLAERVKDACRGRSRE